MGKTGKGQERTEKGWKRMGNEKGKKGEIGARKRGLE